jgi:hypothetical protein
MRATLLILSLALAVTAGRAEALPAPRFQPLPSPRWVTPPAPSCSCSPACTCGCQAGEPCTCPRTLLPGVQGVAPQVAPAPAYHWPAPRAVQQFAPSYQPVFQPSYQPAQSFAPARSLAAPAVSRGASC